MTDMKRKTKTKENPEIRLIVRQKWIIFDSKQNI